MTDILRPLIVVFLVFHGLSHIFWFLAAWRPSKVGVVDGPWILPGDVTLTSVVGRILGIVALVVVVLLLVAAFALLIGEPWWRGAARYGVILSFLVVLPWWPRMPRRIGLQAIIADIVLMFAIALPLSVDII